MSDVSQAPEAIDDELLHTRRYDVTAVRRGDDAFVLRGSVIDEKPPHLYLDDDPEPLVIHHMTVELTVSYPQLTITDADVTFNSFPQLLCPAIASHYRELVGLSIARGFTHEVRARFGGPRGCTHTTALLSAMAPVAVQCHWSMSRLGDQPAPRQAPDQELRLTLNSCHVWAEDGEFARQVTAGERVPGPILPIRRRLEERGVDPDAWWEAHR